MVGYSNDSAEAGDGSSARRASWRASSMYCVLCRIIASWAQASEKRNVNHQLTGEKEMKVSLSPREWPQQTVLESLPGLEIRLQSGSSRSSGSGSTSYRSRFVVCFCAPFSVFAPRDVVTGPTSGRGCKQGGDGKEILTLLIVYSDIETF